MFSRHLLENVRSAAACMPYLLRVVRRRKISSLQVWAISSRNDEHLIRMKVCPEPIEKLHLGLEVTVCEFGEDSPVMRADGMVSMADVIGQRIPNQHIGLGHDLGIEPARTQ